MGRFLLLALFTCATTNGCAVAQAHRDQDQMRTALLDLYTNQVIDNLIRARNCMPIIQLDYTQAQGMITLQTTANLSDAFTTTGPVVNALTSMIGLQNTNQITINAVPVTTSNEVYDAYLEFLAIPDSLITTPDPPPAGAAHICRNYCGMYYWVPVTCSGNFFRLSLLTTAQRGQTLLSPDDAFAVTIMHLDRTSIEAKQYPKGSFLVTLELDKKIPNDSGTLVFTDDSSAKGSASTSRRNLLTTDQPVIQAGYQEPPPPVLVEPAPKDDAGPAAKGDASTDSKGSKSKTFEKFRDPETERWPGLTNRIRITCTMAEINDLESNIPQKAKIVLDHHQPRPPSTEDLLQRANFQLQQLNQNAVRTGKQ